MYVSKIFVAVTFVSLEQDGTLKLRKVILEVCYDF